MEDSDKVRHYERLRVWVVHGSLTVDTKNDPDEETFRGRGNRVELVVEEDLRRG